MAIKDLSRKPYIEDNDTNVRIGIDLPIRKGNDIDGYFASTSTTIEAVKNNIRNLLFTNQGERLFQPNIGTKLRNYLFSQITEGVLVQIQEEVITIFKFWLPFVEVKNIEVKTNNTFNRVSLNIVFNIKQDPNTLDSITLNFSNDNNDEPTGVNTGGR